MAHKNENPFELVERFMSDQRVILRAVVMNAIEKAIRDGMSPEDVNDAICQLLGCIRSEGKQSKRASRKRALKAVNDTSAVPVLRKPKGEPSGTRPLSLQFGIGMR